MYHGSESNTFIRRRTDTNIMKVSNPTNEHGMLINADNIMMPLWLDRDCMPNVLTDDDDLSG